MSDHDTPRQRPVPAGRAAAAGRVGRFVVGEPVRVYVYGALSVVIAILLARGFISGAEAPLWTALVALLLGVPATETARSRVSPVWTETERREDRRRVIDLDQ
jgi:hypothetical protein